MGFNPFQRLLFQAFSCGKADKSHAITLGPFGGWPNSQLLRNDADKPGAKDLRILLAKSGFAQNQIILDEKDKKTKGDRKFNKSQCFPTLNVYWKVLLE